MEVLDNLEMRHFEVRDESGLAFIEYQIQERKYFLTRSEFPEAFEEQGKIDTMLGQVMQMIEETGLRVVPMNKHVKTYFKKHPEKKHLLPVGIHF